MSSKCNNGKNMTKPNQLASREVKDSASNKPLDFRTFEFFRRYSPHIPSQSTPNPTYTSSPNTPDPHQYYSSNEYIWGVTLKNPIYHTRNTEADQLHHHTPPYLKSIHQIPIIYHILGSRASYKRNQPFSEVETLTPSIDGIIIDTISDIQNLITTITQSNTKEYPEFHNFLDFLEGDSTFYGFPKARVSGSGPPHPPKTNPPSTNISYPRLNFNFIANMVSNQPCLVVNSIVFPSAQQPLPIHPEKLLPKFDLDNDVLPEDHIK